MTDPFSDESNTSPIIEIEDKTYMIQKDFNYLSFEQWTNMDSLLKDKDSFKNIHKLLAISILDPKSYKYEDVESISNYLLQQPLSVLTPNIIFFLNSEDILSENIHSCLKIMETQQLNQIQIYMKRGWNLVKSGIGMKFYKRFQMTIYLIMVKFWLYKYKKYSLI
mgnify:FL=1